MSVETPTIEEKQTEQTGQEVELLEEIAELEKPIKKIIEKIKFRIESGEYGLIIGDDASGRVPALILGNFIKKISEIRGATKPNVIFIPGKLSDFSYDSVDELKAHLEKWGLREGKRVLIATDTVKSGESLEVLVKLIKISGYECDIATIGLEDPIVKMIERKINLGSTKIISGRYQNKDNPHTPRIYKSDSRGVSKSASDHVSYRYGYFNEKRQKEAQSIVNMSRKDANIIVEHLVDWYESRTKSSSPS